MDTSETTNRYEAVIGLEIHAELVTAQKMFCACPNDAFAAVEPNTYICPVCVGLPGALPVMNRQAVEWAIKVGLATGCTIGDNGMTKWDRKNYFYPDLPKAYQISQYDQPLCHDGEFRISDDQVVALTRIHLEEDTGRLVHATDKGYSLIDYNRSGVPLLELVTEPVIRSGEGAAAFASAYQYLLRKLGVSPADMEKGQMRVEANISIRPVGSGAFGTKVEVKNLNSLRSVRRAIEYEIDRQAEILNRGENVVQETRGWNERTNTTFSQRVKETAADYRYFPEPDLPPVTFDGSGISIDALRHDLPEHHLDTLLRWQKDFGISQQTGRQVIFDIAKAEYLEKVLGELSDPQLGSVVANWVVNELRDTDIPSPYIAELAVLMDEGMVTPKLAKNLLVTMRSDGRSPRQIITDEGLAVIRDATALAPLVSGVLAAHPQAVRDLRGGTEKALGFLVGQVMAASQGQADPGQAREEIVRQVTELAKEV